MDIPDVSHKPSHPRVPRRSIQPISQSDFCEEGAELINRWHTASAPFQTNELISLEDEVMSYEEKKLEARADLIYHREHCPLCMTKPHPESFLHRIGSSVLVLSLGLLAIPILCIVYIFPKRDLSDFWLSDFWN